MNDSFDITIIGSGPGGYVAAIRAAQLGYRVALVEKYDTLGGTCTNVGCIPSKALLDSTEHFHTAQEKFREHGIETSPVALNFAQLIQRKNKVVGQNTAGLQFLMKKNKIEVVQGWGIFKDQHQLLVKREGVPDRLLSSQYFIIATGSKPASIPGVEINKQRIISSTEALNLKEKPDTMVIIGGGIIGVEMASIFARIGVKVTIIEYMDRLIPTMDHELGQALKKILAKLHINIILKAKVQSAVQRREKVTVSFIHADHEEQSLSADYCLVAVGRKPYTENVGLDTLGIEKDSKGFIKVNHLLQTTLPHIYAIGDVIGGAMLAHKAEEEGIFAVEAIAGKQHPIQYHLIPGVVYTWPEVASVGYTEEYLKEKGTPYRTGKFPFSALGRARASMDTEGFVKVLADPKYGEILGVHIIGPRAADLIAQAVVGMTYEVTDEDMFRISYAHPTYAEALKEAYLMASGQGALNL